MSQKVLPSNDKGIYYGKSEMGRKVFDLNAKLIEENRRYNYYNIKIEDSKSNEVAIEREQKSDNIIQAIYFFGDKK